MKSVDINTAIIEGYLRLLDNLSPSSKLDLISKLTASVKSDITNKKTLSKKLLVHFNQKRVLMKSLTKFVAAEPLPDKLKTFEKISY
ncbi:MAG: hypothetical protein WKG06_33450 [Segetibacter sp.]